MVHAPRQEVLDRVRHPRVYREKPEILYQPRTRGLKRDRNGSGPPAPDRSRTDGDGQDPRRRPPRDAAHTLQRIRFSDPSTGYAIGRDGALVTTQDGGATWETPESFKAWPLRSQKWVDIAISPEGWVAVTGESGLVARDMSAWDQGRAPILRSAPNSGEGLRWALPTPPGTWSQMETSSDLSAWSALGQAYWSKGWYQSTPLATASEQPVFYRVVSPEPTDVAEQTAQGDIA